MLSGTDEFNSLEASLAKLYQSGLIKYEDGELTAVNEEIFRIMGLHRHARLVRGDDEAGE